ncbi:MAG: VOC family protein [Azospirillaceae bacterium]|nr:VOC family protein [Azospirillaceae bacterium]
MDSSFPGAVPEIPVRDLAAAVAYYQSRLGFTLDWGGGTSDGIAGISKGACRLFLTGTGFREAAGNHAPVVVWLNLDSRAAVDTLHRVWDAAQARIVDPPADKPWKLREFTAADPDGNLLRVFYDFGNGGDGDAP